MLDEFYILGTINGFQAFTYLYMQITKCGETMEISEMNQKQLAGLASIMKTIAHPDRLRILCILKGGRKNVTELEKLLDDNQSFVSQQLRLLRLNDLVVSEKENGFVYYSIVSGKKRQIEKIMSGLCDLCPN
jgi:DNA-binding transcriptional ArsR family regulator